MRNLRWFKPVKAKVVPHTKKELGNGQMLPASLWQHQDKNSTEEKLNISDLVILSYLISVLSC